MQEEATSILADLHRVRAERQLRAADPTLLSRVHTIKAYQQRRFELTYADLLQNQRYFAAARFFLDDLYGPTDFTDRDAQFERVVPTLVRLLPAEVIGTVGAITRLHALSESLDSDMARQLGDDSLTSRTYVRAWRGTGRRDDRMQQIAMTLSVGGALDRFTRKPVLRTTLRLMRVPAEAAGFGALQRFLECGFDAFRAMGGAQDFLRFVERRERSLADDLFDAPNDGEGVLYRLPPS